MKLNDKGFALICEFEGCRTEAYQDAVGVWTIGYGHTSVAGPPSVGPGVTVTRAEAAGILMRDLETFSTGVRSAITAPLNDNQFSALVSFAFNVGLGNFRSSSVLRSVNACRFDQVPADLALWVKAGGKVLPGLIRRRAAEAALFLAGDLSVALPTADRQTVHTPRKQGAASSRYPRDGASPATSILPLCFQPPAVLFHLLLIIWKAGSEIAPASPWKSQP